MTTSNVDSRLYYYKAVVTRVVDGDTIDCEVDTGFNNFSKIRFRLAGIDTPERHTQAGKVAKEFLCTLIEGKEVIVRSFKEGGWGRWAADVYLGDLYVNEYLVLKGQAVPYSPE